MRGRVDIVALDHAVPVHRACAQSRTLPLDSVILLETASRLLGDKAYKQDQYTLPIFTSSLLIILERGLQDWLPFFPSQQG
jgi:hypothetical protein